MIEELKTMSAFGTKRTSPSALHMSAIGGKADINVRSASREKNLQTALLVIANALFISRAAVLGVRPYPCTASSRAYKI